jgi:hypothetical protein
MPQLGHMPWLFELSALCLSIGSGRFEEAMLPESRDVLPLDGDMVRRFKPRVEDV